MSITSFADAVRALEKFVPRPYKSSEVYSLDTIRALMQYLGNPQDELKIVHVAGTSGKTSTAYYTAALLTAAGHNVGLTVSPHVDQVNERLQINMVPLAESEFCKALAEFIDLVADSGLTPTYYELIIAFVYREFARRKLDYAVIEVGLGGLLDGSNIAGRADKVCIITDIGLDHTRLLGNTLAKITAQKAGIIHEGNEVFMYAQGAEIDGIVDLTVAQKHAGLHRITPLSSEYQTDLPLFQQRNFYLARQAADFMLARDGRPPLTADQTDQAADTFVPARMETVRLPSGQLLIMDGAHNGQKIASLMQSLRAKYPDNTISVLTAFVVANDERWRDGMDILMPETDNLILTEFTASQDSPRPSVAARTIQKYLDASGFAHYKILRDPVLALRELQKLDSDILLIVGSFHLLGAVRPYIL